MGIHDITRDGAELLATVLEALLYGKAHVDLEHAY